ncbi:MAG TPA: helix-turn-helix transcriptional regulator [Candidatus Obscuribacterales bacterium]
MQTLKDADDDRFLAAIGMVIAERRLARGLTQQELASSTHLHRAYISDIERGIRNVGIMTLHRIAASMEISVSAILDMAQERMQVGTQKGAV